MKTRASVEAARPLHLTDEGLTELVDALIRTASSSKIEIRDRDALRAAVREATEAYTNRLNYSADARESVGDLFVDELDELAKWLRSLLTVVPDYRGFALLQHEGNFGSLALSLARSDVDAWDDRIGSAVDQLDALNS